MTITAYINDSLGIRVHLFTDLVTRREALALSQFYHVNARLLHTDVVSLIHESAASEAALEQHLETLRHEYRRLHAGAHFFVQRRSAWVCPNRQGWGLLEAWLHERHAHDGQGTEVCLAATLGEIGALFEPDEIDAIETWRDFRKLTEIPAPPFAQLA